MTIEFRIALLGILQSASVMAGEAELVRKCEQAIQGLRYELARLEALEDAWYESQP